VINIIVNTWPIRSTIGCHFHPLRL
jgi:hypothetical protein